MFFTVVIPTHQRKHLLKKLLNSLQVQSFDSSQFEVKVIATKEDPAYQLDLSKYTINVAITSIPNDPTQGRSASAKRNYGVSLAQGEWIAFIDDDCLADSEWLRAAQQKINESPIEFLEGAVFIPPMEHPTFTHKGIQRLSSPGGFQTCNMFYKREDFLQLGGFDPMLPYYLEDTDLAWTFKEAQKKHSHADKAIVSHPTPLAAPKKMLESAFRMEKLPYLYKKHPITFKESKMRALPRPYFILCLLDVLGFVLLFLNPFVVLPLLLIRLFLTVILTWRMLRDCKTSFQEASSMFCYMLICPLLSLIYLLKGNIKHRTCLLLR